MKEKIIVALLSALIGGAGNNILDGQRTAGRLDSIERAVVRIETRLDAMTTPVRP